MAGYGQDPGFGDQRVAGHSGCEVDERRELDAR